MKLPGKPISSPGRAEKYPPPLMMRFLRSNVGSRSRGRSRTSPMFVQKRNTAVETQEPSSPKVTCMGQVRVRRSQQSAGKPCSATRKRCRWIRTVQFCHYFRAKSNPKPAKPSWTKWVVFFHGGFRKEKISEDSSGIGSKCRTEFEYSGHGNEEESEDEEANVFASSSRSPPKNALLLTRCRSAPYRSSSLAYRFWGSPLAREEEERTERETRGEERPTSERESICRDSGRGSIMDPEAEEKPSLFREIEERIGKSKKKEAEQLARSRPLTLTRCKSEPARTGEMVDPELSYFNKRRLGFT